MGTSKSLSTPAGGAWTSVKREVGSAVQGGSQSPEQIIADVIAATGGLVGPLRGLGPSLSAGSGGGGGSSGAGRSRSGGGGSGARAHGRASVGRVVSGLGGFASDIRQGGLDRAIEKLGIADLREKPAVEVIALISVHFAEGADGLQRELLAQALHDAMLEAAVLEGDRSYENLAASLQTFVGREGIEGLIELFLTHYVFGQVWTLVENHAERRAPSIADTQALATAVEGACRGHVVGLMQDLRTEGRFDDVDWFGPGGAELGQGIVRTLEFRLRTPNGETS